MAVVSIVPFLPKYRILTDNITNNNNSSICSNSNNYSTSNNSLNISNS